MNNRLKNRNELASSIGPILSRRRSIDRAMEKSAKRLLEYQTRCLAGVISIARINTGDVESMSKNSKK